MDLCHEPATIPASAGGMWRRASIRRCTKRGPEPENRKKELMQSLSRGRRKRQTACLVNLGCHKNQVDAEIMMGVLDDRGYRLVIDPAEAELIIVNTCGFLAAAREESLQTIREMAGFRRGGRLQCLVVAGCMADRDRQWLLDRVDGIDRFASSFQLDRLDQVIRGEEPFQTPLSYQDFQWARTARWVSTPRSFGFVKISDGCDNRCAYCRIPFLRGPFRSKPPDDIILELEELVASGRKEAVIISQDSTSYGKDLELPGGFHGLMKRMASVPGLKRLRLMYLYPSRVDEALLDIIGGHPVICRYLDMPLQHTDPKILQAMNRHVPEWMTRGTDPVLKFLERIRKAVPGITIRTTLMTGFPGETDGSFRSMRDVVESGAFDHLGVFAWSPEPDTGAYGATRGCVERTVAEDRASQLMTVQAEVAETRNRALLGSSLEVVVDGPDEDEEGYVVGRTEFQAPEVDGWVRMKADLPAGEWGYVRLDHVDLHDFEGSWIGEMG